MGPFIWSPFGAHFMIWDLWGPIWALGRSGPIVGPWAIRAQLLDPRPFGPICWTMGRSGPIVGPWAVRAYCLDPGPFGPIVWTLGRSGPLFGPWAVRAHWLGISILQGGWACPMPGWACPMPGWACPISRLGMSHIQVGHVPCPGWACPMPCLLYTSPSPRDQRGSRMPSSA